jgi:hypothetical protein
MKYTYEETEFNTIIRTDENGEMAFIPMVAGNSDYQRYLNPEAEQSKENFPPV